MKAFLLGLAALVVIAIVAGVMLNFESETTAARYTTSNVRL